MIMSQSLQIKEDIRYSPSIDEDIVDQTNQKLNTFNQKVHNDQHIFYSLKAAANDNFDQSIFSISMQSTDPKQSRLRVRIKSKQDLRNSINLKTALPETQFQPAKKSNKNAIKLKSTQSVQRVNKKIDLKYTQKAQTKLNQQQKNKIFWTDNSYDEGFKLKRKTEIKRRNYFNVKQFMETEAKRKKDSAVIMMKSNSNSLIKKKRQNILGKIQQPSQKIKEFQFNAIQITKNLVEKGYGKYGANNKIRNQDKKYLLKPNKSYNEGLNGQKKELISVPTIRQYFDQKQINELYKQRGSLWRSNSYQIPRSKQTVTKSMIRTGSIKEQKFVQNSVRNVEYDHNIDLNPWNMGQQMEFSNQKSRYAVYKTQNKNHEEEHEFLNYYIKTARHQRDKY